MTTIDCNYRGDGFPYKPLTLHTRRQLPPLDLRIYTLVSSIITLFAGVCGGWKFALVVGAVCFFNYTLQRKRPNYFWATKVSYIPVEFESIPEQQRDRQIIIHEEAAKQKLAKGLKRAALMEVDRPPQGFEGAKGNIVKRWNPKVNKTRVRFQGKEQSFDISVVQAVDIAYAQSQGRRPHMEDVVVSQVWDSTLGGQPTRLEMVALLDGHRGIPDLTAEAISTVLTHRLQLHCNQAITDVAMCNALVQTTVDLKDRVNIRGGGATLTLVLRVLNHLWIANVGDSRAFAISPTSDIVPLTEDARVRVCGKPDQMNEHLVGPALIRGGRIKGKSLLSKGGVGLNLLRSLGDHHFPGSTARAKICKYPIEDHLLVVMGSDGLFSQGTSQEVGNYVYKLFEKEIPLDAITARTVQLALAAGAKDNLTCLVKSYRLLRSC